MEDVLKQQDKKRAELLKEQERSWKQAEKASAKETAATVEDKQIDYAARTAKLEAEWGENQANQEAMEGVIGNRGFNDVEFIKYDPTYRRLADYIGVDAGDLSKVAEELGVVMGWAVENSEARDITDVLSAVRNLKKSLGFQEVGVTALKKLHRYIRLDMDSKQASKEERKFIEKEKELLK